MEKENRMHFLDSARGIGILLVMLGHIWENENPGIVLIYSFHVPLFFIISGILMAYTEVEKRSWKQILISRVRGLVMPYLFYEGVFLVIFGLKNGFDFSSQNGSWYDFLLMKPLNVPMWFLITIFAAEMFVILIQKFLKNRYASAAVFAAVFLLSFAGEGLGERDTAAVLFRCMSAVGFLAMGYFSCEFVREKNLPWHLLVILGILDLAAALWNGKVGIYKMTFRNPLIFTLCAVLGSYLVLFGLKRIRIQALELIGQHTVPILGLHIIALRVLQEILGLRTDGYVGGIVALAVLTVLLTIAGMILERILPFTAGKKRR